MWKERGRFMRKEEEKGWGGGNRDSLCGWKKKRKVVPVRPYYVFSAGLVPQRKSLCVGGARDKMGASFLQSAPKVEVNPSPLSLPLRLPSSFLLREIGLIQLPEGATRVVQLWSGDDWVKFGLLLLERQYFQPPYFHRL